MDFVDVDSGARRTRRLGEYRSLAEVERTGRRWVPSRAMTLGISSPTSALPASRRVCGADIQSRRCSAIDVRIVRNKGYAQSINARRLIEQVVGWIKQAARLRQLKARVRSRIGAVFRLHVMAYNLIRLANLLALREAMK
ncbi:hypothetical protein NZK32_05110 [Cyanobium sp. FGCU-52]|nr:hypothetical protein [Cyanobium sp. FGCU52]